MYVFRVWTFEIVLSGINFFVLMNRIYEPKYGKLKAHQIGMVTRILYIPFFAYALIYFANLSTISEFLLAGLYWLLMILAFEWIGSIVFQRRPIKEILEGWHIEEGFMWPYVLLTYFLSPLIIGILLAPGR